MRGLPGEERLALPPDEKIAIHTSPPLINPAPLTGFPGFSRRLFVPDPLRTVDLTRSSFFFRWKRLVNFSNFIPFLLFDSTALCQFVQLSPKSFLQA